MSTQNDKIALTTFAKQVFENYGVDKLEAMLFLYDAGMDVQTIMNAVMIEREMPPDPFFGKEKSARKPNIN